ncbi:putative sterigmatocystin biosynthesis monooxygenase stcW [Neonectria ditissima]|uniref:Putative sterigmatocystin biosynthesis monooxygenase stcW n=1 Tax=Neonectria ditissima TaxID=78410 RepID=A0A0P7BGH4_9HYPO|nr:putative sterigmatocystin biosynthesis monooxygenase stcW [Neonectria ditissima]
MWTPTKAKEAASNGKSDRAPYDFDPADPANFSRRAIDHLRPIKVIVIGCGMSGIIAGIFFPRSIANLELAIYDKNPDLGGTWYESRYPGVACDVPSHAYQFTFESNHKWSRYWASGGEIQNYLKSVASKYGADKYMKFNHNVDKAEWDEKEGKWTVTFTRTDTGEVITDKADVLIQAVGALNKWKMPEIKGLDTFKGRLMHSANYDTDFDATGKRVALIGGGSSGIQILPQMQPIATRVDHYMKGKTWIPPFGIGALGVLDRNGDPNTPKEELEEWKDPKKYLEYRCKIEGSLNEASDVLYKDTPNALGFQKMCEDHMRAKLAKKPEIFEALRPSFAPACRRLTPGPGYLEALVEDNVEFIPTNIQEVVEDGIVTEDGKKRQVDAIICATGFAGYKQHFPVIGKDGINLQDQWSNDIPESYVGLAPENMPNFFIFLGPNGGPDVGSTVPFLENGAKYMILCIQKLQREWYKSMTAKRTAIKDFGRYTDEYLEPTVFNSTCNAWWRHNGNGRILALWPGSALHGMYLWSNPRWEDYDYELKEELKGNPFKWLGNGFVRAQVEGKRTTSYLDHSVIPV